MLKFKKFGALVFIVRKDNVSIFRINEILKILKNKYNGLKWLILIVANNFSIIKSMSSQTSKFCRYEKKIYSTINTLLKPSKKFGCFSQPKILKFK